MIVSEFFNYLVHSHHLDEDLIQEEMEDREVNTSQIKQFLLSRRYISETDYQKSLAEFLKLPYLDTLPEINADFIKKFVEQITHNLVYSHLFFPFGDLDKDDINFAIVDAKAINVCEEIAEMYGKKAVFHITKESNIINAIQQHYHIDDIGAIGQEDKSDTENYMEVEDLLSSDDEEPIRRLVNSIIFQALKTNASDIHIDATDQDSVVRNRIDGVLQQLNSYPKHGHNRIINRIKVMSGLDISTRNVPQDGRALIKIAGKKVDIRVSVIPTIHGERVVMRLLQQSHQLLNTSELGLNPEIEKLLLSSIHSPNGIILVTGPTGSGKTTTLYACLQAIDHNSRNVLTIEDPVEYQISGYGQVQVNEKQKLTFAAGLRTILRQDPDVIMVGEIRDMETAQIAIQSALTGHLVLSTLHTNDAVSTVIRLFDMNIEPFLVSSTLKCVLSQRLVRRLCEKCCQKETKPWSEIQAISVPESLKKDYKGYIYKAVGCEECSDTGYKGRLAVNELLTIDDSIKDAIHQKVSSTDLSKIALKSGCLITLARDCFLKCFNGQTSLDEVNRLLFEIKGDETGTSDLAEKLPA